MQDIITAMKKATEDSTPKADKVVVEGPSESVATIESDVEWKWEILVLLAVNLSVCLSLLSIKIVQLRGTALKRKKVNKKTQKQQEQIQGCPI